MAKNFLWDVINNVSNGKRMLRREEFDAKQYNAFMVVKTLSMDPNLAPYLLHFNYPNMRKADPYMHYVALFKFIPKKFRKTKFLKGTQTKYSKDMVSAAKAYFQISDKKAEVYLDTLSEANRQELLKICISNDIIVPTEKGKKNDKADKK